MFPQLPVIFPTVKGPALADFVKVGIIVAEPEVIFPKVTAPPLPPVVVEMVKLVAVVDKVNEPILTVPVPDIVRVAIPGILAMVLFAAMLVLPVLVDALIEGF